MTTDHLVTEEAVEAVLSREGRKYGYMTADFVRADLQAAAPAIAAKAVEEKDAEIERLRESRDLHERVAKTEERRRHEAEAERDSISESYDRMKVARTEALRERDRAIQKERERLKARALAKSDEFVAAYWGTGAEPTETFRVSVRAALDAWLDAALQEDDSD